MVEWVAQMRRGSPQPVGTSLLAIQVRERFVQIVSYTFYTTRILRSINSYDLIFLCPVKCPYGSVIGYSVPVVGNPD